MSKEQLLQELIVPIAKEYVGGGRTLDELVAAGKEGLKIAEEKYDGQQDFSFESYATWWIRQRILQHICQSYKDIRSTQRIITQS